MNRDALNVDHDGYDNTDVDGTHGFHNKTDDGMMASSKMDQ